MKILIVNTYDYGGAANSCKRLHIELLEEKIDSKLLLKYKEQDWPQSFLFSLEKFSYSFSEKVKNRGKRLLKKTSPYLKRFKKQKVEITSFLQNRPERLEMYSLPYSNLDITKSPLYQEADIINLHWVANFLDYKSFFRNNKKPVVWTLHDMNAFSGIDHYTETYLGLNERGKPISRSISIEEYQINKNIIDIKKRWYKNARNLTIVTPSQWLAKEARKSRIFSNKAIEIIPYGLNKKIFYPRGQKASREALNLPLDKKVVLFVADSVSNHRKGFEYLRRALLKFNTRDVVLCAIGKTINLDVENVVQLGQINDEDKMSLAYSAADIFIIPSLMDNLPNTVLESLMCGTPVIGFPVGGIPEMVQTKFNGIIAQEISVDSLGAAIRDFLNHPEIFDREAIRKAAVQKYDSYIQAKRYISLFEKIYDSKEKRK